MAEDFDLELERGTAIRFLSEFADADGESKYMNILQDVANRKYKAIQIDLEDLLNYEDLDEEFLRRVTQNTRRYLGIFADAIDLLMPKPTEAFSDDDHDVLMTHRSEQGTDVPDQRQRMPPEIKRSYEIYIRASQRGQPFTIWEVKASNIGQLVRISGIVTRCSDVKPLMTCDECAFEVYQEVTARDFKPLFECPSSRCKTNEAKGNPILELRASKFLKFQEAKIQELAEHVPQGHIPRTMTIHFRGELTRKVSPGEVVEFSGIFLPIPYTGFRAMRAGLVADTYLEAMSVDHLKKKYEEDHVSVAKTFSPSIPRELEEYTVSAYTRIRQDEAKTDSPHSYITVRTPFSILGISSSDVDEALRLMQISKSSLYKEDRKKDRKKDCKKARLDPITSIFDPITSIYAILRAEAYRLNSMKVSYADVLNWISSKGYSEDQLEQCLEEYQLLNSLLFNTETGDIEFIVELSY